MQAVRWRGPISGGKQPTHLDPSADGPQVFIQQAALLGAEALTLSGKLQALEVSVLMCKLVDGGLFEGDRLEQGLHHLAQFVCAHVGELLGGDHYETQCISGE